MLLLASATAEISTPVIHTLETGFSETLPLISIAGGFCYTLSSRKNAEEQRRCSLCFIGSRLEAPRKSETQFEDIRRQGEEGPCHTCSSPRLPRRAFVSQFRNTAESFWWQVQNLNLSLLTCSAAMTANSLYDTEWLEQVAHLYHRTFTLQSCNFPS